VASEAEDDRHRASFELLAKAATYNAMASVKRAVWMEANGKAGADLPPDALAEIREIGDMYVNSLELLERSFGSGHINAAYALYDLSVHLFDMKDFAAVEQGAHSSIRMLAPNSPRARTQCLAVASES
jgi:hypothetical protein